jgi:hypothetical protein
MQPRIILRLEVTRKVGESWLKISEARGMNQVTIASRLIEWYGKQPHTIQALIMDQIPPAIREEVIEIALRKLGRV